MLILKVLVLSLGFSTYIKLDNAYDQQVSAFAKKNSAFDINNSTSIVLAHLLRHRRQKLMINIENHKDNHKSENTINRDSNEHSIEGFK